MEERREWPLFHQDLYTRSVTVPWCNLICCFDHEGIWTGAWRNCLKSSYNPSFLVDFKHRCITTGDGVSWLCIHPNVCICCWNHEYDCPRICAISYSSPVLFRIEYWTLVIYVLNCDINRDRSTTFWASFICCEHRQLVLFLPLTIQCGQRHNCSTCRIDFKKVTIRRAFIKRIGELCIGTKIGIHGRYLIYICFVWCIFLHCCL